MSVAAAAKSLGLGWDTTNALALAAAATLIRSRQSRCSIQRVTLSVVFELSGAQFRDQVKIISMDGFQGYATAAGG